MARMARIEVQDQFGHWRRFQTVIASDTSIKLALQRALKTQLASGRLGKGRGYSQG